MTDQLVPGVIQMVHAHLHWAYQLHWWCFPPPLLETDSSDKYHCSHEFSCKLLVFSSQFPLKWSQNVAGESECEIVFLACSVFTVEYQYKNWWDCCLSECFVFQSKYPENQGKSSSADTSLIIVNTQETKHYSMTSAIFEYCTFPQLADIGDAVAWGVVEEVLPTSTKFVLLSTLKKY